MSKWQSMTSALNNDKPASWNGVFQILRLLPAIQSCLQLLNQEYCLNFSDFFQGQGLYLKEFQDLRQASLSPSPVAIISEELYCSAHLSELLVTSNEPLLNLFKHKVHQSFREFSFPACCMKFPET